MNRMFRRFSEVSTAISMRSFVCAALLTLSLLGAAARGQEPSPQPTACVSSAMLGQMASDGSLVRVIAASSSATGVADAKGRGSKASFETQPKQTLREAFKKFERDARRGSASAQLNLAVATLAGWGTEPNSGAALFWLIEAARQRFPLAYFDMGILYQNGCGVRQDYTEAARYFALGADAGDAHSEMNLGYLYDRGLGISRDRAQAAEHYRKAADAGFAQAEFNLADLYLRGEGVAADATAAFHLFEKAALQGHANARLMVAAMLTAGRGTERDPSTAYAWLYAALLSGDSRAKAPLSLLAAELAPEQVAVAKARGRSLAEQGSQASELAAVLR